MKSALVAALDTLFTQDAHLLIADVNERSISHRLAGHLEPHFQGWNVDCEYNRNHDKIKTLNIPRRRVPNDDTLARTVFPDVIVHRRNTDENLLVIEMKKTTSREPDSFDRKKLNAFKAQIGYKFAVFIKIRINEKPSVETIDWV